MTSRFVSVLAVGAALALGATGVWAQGMQGGHMQPPQGQDEMRGPMGPGGGYGMMGGGHPMMDPDGDEDGGPGMGGPGMRGYGMMGYGMGPGMMGYGMGPGMMGYGPRGPWMMGPGMMGPERMRRGDEWHHHRRPPMGYGRGYGRGYGWGYGMGPGMMGYPMMGPGMMGYPMMGYPMMHHGYGMMRGCPMMDHEGHRAARKDLSVDDVKKMMSNWIERTGNPNLKLGKVADSGKDAITADVVTKDGSLVRSYVVDKHTGATHPADMEK